MAQIKLHQQVHVAIRSEIVPERRPEDRQARNPMPTAELGDRLAGDLVERQGHADIIGDRQATIGRTCFLDIRHAEREDRGALLERDITGSLLNRLAPRLTAPVEAARCDAS